MNTYFKSVSILLLLAFNSYSHCNISDFSFDTFKNYFSQKKIIEPEHKIGIVKIIGKIDVENTEKILKKIIGFSEEMAIKGILLIISSEGGSSAATELIFREIQILSAIKPIVTLVINECCSGSFKIASGSNWIIAPAASTIGSIGTIQFIVRHRNSHVKKNDYEADVEYELIHAGKYKAMYHAEASALDDEQREYIKADINEIYKIFYTIIAQQRNLSIDKIHEWADGKCFTGETALKLGLIDQIGGYSDAVKKLRALIEKKDIKLKEKLIFVE